VISILASAYFFQFTDVVGESEQSKKNLSALLKISFNALHSAPKNSLFEQNQKVSALP
jgi:hypothetical protein